MALINSLPYSRVNKLEVSVTPQSMNVGIFKLQIYQTNQLEFIEVILTSKWNVAFLNQLRNTAKAPQAASTIWSCGNYVNPQLLSDIICKRVHNSIYYYTSDRTHIRICAILCQHLAEEWLRDRLERDDHVFSQIKSARVILWQAIRYLLKMECWEVSRKLLQLGEAVVIVLSVQEGNLEPSV